MSIIQIKNLRKDFQIEKKADNLKGRVKQLFKPERETVEAVKEISLEVERGEMLAFIGPNGAGKSTTIKILTGILHPSSGHCQVLDYVPWQQRQQLAFKIGSVFGQKSQLWLHLPPLDAFNLLARIYELDSKEYQKRRDYLVEVFELQKLIHIPTRKLSLGQRMRCEIAACLLHSPEVIFLDEPTIGLDPVVKGSIRKLIKRANEEDKVTIFLTSHDTGDIEKLCKRVVIINQGTVVLDGTVNRLRREFLTRKTIGLKLGQDYLHDLEIHGMDLLKHKGAGVKFMVDTALLSVEQAMTSIMEKYRVKDINIKEIPLEDVISDIYQRGVQEV